MRRTNGPNPCAVARALQAQGETSRARGELEAARRAFESLGAQLDLARLAAFEASVGGHS
jgi:hypothetical protein